MRLRKRSTFLIGVAAAVCLAVTLTGTAFAGPPSGIKGEPQPEAKPFRISAAGQSPASIAFRAEWQHGRGLRRHHQES